MVQRGEAIRYDGRTNQFAPLLPGPSADFVTYSNDGKWMAYVTFPNVAALSLDSTRVAIFDFSTAKWREVASGVLSGFPCWSHDSRYLYYLRGTVNPAVMRVRPSGGKAEPAVDLKDVHTTGFYGLSLSLTPDDRPTVTRDNGSMEIFAIDWRAP